MQSKTKYNNKYDIILFGGDRLLEKGPLSQLSIFLKNKNISYISIIDPIHAKKNTDHIKYILTLGSSFMEFQNINLEF